MKKVAAGLISLIIGCGVFFLGANTKTNIIPNYYYQVYLDDQVIGVIKSKDELERYIDEQGSNIKEKYGVGKVYVPNGLEVRKVITYSDKVSSVEDVYKTLSELRHFTIDGYQFTVKREVENDDGEKKQEDVLIYTINDEIFDKALYNVVEAFVGKDNLSNFMNNTQPVVKDTGSTYSDIYVDNDITRKQTRISVDEHIFTNEKDLSQYLLFSSTEESKAYVVQSGDTIESVSEKNKISVEEFLISNPDFTSKDNMLYTGQVVTVAYANPIVDVVANVVDVRDETSYYTTEEHETDDLIIGYERVAQEGANGIDRVTRLLVYKNGFIEGTEPISTVEIKPPVKKIVYIGTKYVSGVGGRYWSWPSSIYYVSSYFGYRSGRLHHGIDIAGPYWTPVYAANNGVITMLTSSYGTYGLFIAINHNNGYGTAYGHLQAFASGLRVGSVVERGQVIGWIGNTGRSTGPHLHFEAYWGSSHPGYTTSLFFNPYNLFN